jgi:hypothetical protein
MTQENPGPMSKHGGWPPALVPAVTGAIVIRDFEREGQVAATASRSRSSVHSRSNSG